MPAPRRPQAAAIDALLSIAPLVTRWIERLLAGHDPPLTLAQFLTLRAIAHEAVGSSEIARRTAVSGPAVSQLIAGLADAGLIERSPVAGDRRRYALALSSDGERAFRSAEALLRRRLSPLLAGIPRREADSLARLLPIVEAALSGSPPPRRSPSPPPPHLPHHRP